MSETFIQTEIEATNALDRYKRACELMGMDFEDRLKDLVYNLNDFDRKELALQFSLKLRGIGLED